MVVFYYGQQAQFDLLTPKNAEALYFIEDTQRIYKGETLQASVDVLFVAKTPEFDAAQEGKLYVVSDGSTVTIYTKGDAGMDKVAGGELDPGSISNIGMFDESLITTSAELADGVLPQEDTTIPTSKAVHDAIAKAVEGMDEAFVSVEAAAAGEGTSGTVLKFTKQGGGTQQVTIADIFLSAASYDADSHILTLTLNDEEQSTVTVDLTDIIGNEFSDVKVGEAEAFTVQLGSGGTLGGYKTGDSISADTSLLTVVKKLLMKQVPPTYSQPSVSIANNGGTASGNIEIGTTVTPKVRATFNKADAGELVNIQFKKGGSSVGEAITSSPADYTEAAFVLESAVTFSATATYGEGEIKNDNLGQPYEEGHIEAGSKNSTNYTFTPYRKGFYGTLADKSGAIDSALVRSLPSTTTSAPANGNTWNLSIPVGAMRVAFAYPATLRDVTSVIDVNGMNAEVKSSFTKHDIQVEGAEAYEAIAYKVYVMDRAVATDTANTYKVTI